MELKFEIDLTQNDLLTITRILETYIKENPYSKEEGELLDKLTIFLQLMPCDCYRVKGVDDEQNSK